MKQNMFIKYLNYLLFIFILSTFISCDETINDSLKENQPPDTKIFLYPDSSISPQPSKLTIAWWADDPDGIVIGYYYKWNGSEWEFTTENEISFALQIGASDALYNFQVAAVDNNGNRIYDNSIIRNGIDFGPEPFEDKNGDGIYNLNEIFYDIGDVDPEPASQIFPIKNSAPVIEWNTLSSLPAESFPVTTIGWNVDDLDGLETIKRINIALNDSTNFISLDGAVRTITIRVEDFNNDNPLMQILINGNLSDKKLSGIKLNAENIVYVQAEDISGAKSDFIKLPNEEGKTWKVNKPKGKFLLLDDNPKLDNAESFYKENIDNLLNGNFAGNYDTWDLNKYDIPYEGITFFETLKLFDVILWYSDNQPNIDLASSSIRKYIEFGGNVIFTSVLPHPVDLLQLQDFLPIDSLAAPIKFVGANIDILSDSLLVGYPNLKTSGSNIKVQTFYTTEASVTMLYSLPQLTAPNSQVIAFKSNDNKIFFFGLPLHECDGISGNVKILLEKILFEDFGLSL